MHFLAAAYGIGLVVCTTLAGGFVQGVAWSDPAQGPTLVTQSLMPFLVGRSLGWLFLIVSHLFFAVHFLTMLLRLGRPSGRPTLFPTHLEEESH